MAYAWKNSKNRGFFFGPSEDTPVNWDLNWKHRVEHEAKEQERFRRNVVNSLPTLPADTDSRRPSRMSRAAESRQSRLGQSLPDLDSRDEHNVSLPRLGEPPVSKRAAINRLEKTFVEFLEQERARGRHYGPSDFSNASRSFNRWSLKNPAKRTW